jgi:4-carboxymuconolactone decarboxylase
MTSDNFEKGMKMRRAVLGDAHVDRSMNNVDDFSRDLQTFLTEVGWGMTWARPGLDRRSRSILTLGMLTALNRPHELKIHLVGALNNGLTKDEIKEVLLQTAVYCGAPAAIDAFRTAREVFQERGI